MASSVHTRDDDVLTPREIMESSVCLLTRWTLKVNGLQKLRVWQKGKHGGGKASWPRLGGYNGGTKSDSVFLINWGAYALVKEIVFLLEGLDIFQNALMMPLRTHRVRLAIRAVPCFCGIPHFMI